MFWYFQNILKYFRSMFLGCPFSISIFWSEYWKQWLPYPFIRHDGSLSPLKVHTSKYLLWLVLKLWVRLPRPKRNQQNKQWIKKKINVQRLGCCWVTFVLVTTALLHLHIIDISYFPFREIFTGRHAIPFVKFSVFKLVDLFLK